MTIYVSSSLTKKQQSMILELTASCREYEPLTLTFPLEDAGQFFLAAEHDMLCCALFLSEAADSICECSAFTRPSYRNRGIFSKLLSLALDSLPEETQLVFPTDGHSPDAKQTLLALGAEFWYAEHLMELSADRLAAGDFSVSEKIPTPSFSGHDSSDRHLVFCSDSGTCGVLLYDAFSYLYGLEVAEGKRHKGHGRALLFTVLEYLRRFEKKPVRLQVQSGNQPALRLYEKTGFQYSETLSYYLY